MHWTQDVVREVLPNGLTILVQSETSAPVVAVVTHVKAGYFDEPDDWIGISHVLEHMYFKGTARRGPGDIARETQLLGGYCNAGTIYDKTVYYTVLPSAGDGLARALDIHADALMHAALDADELEREIEVIVQEAKRKQDSPEAITTETLFSVLFRVHRMRRWRIGTEAGLRSLTRDDLHRYYTTRYAPGRVIVGIVGAVDPARALDATREAFEPWERETPALEPGPAEPDVERSECRVLRGDIERPLLGMGWRTVPALHDDVPALDIAASILSGGRSARLYRALRRPGIVNGVAASHYSPTEVGVFTVTLETEAQRLEEAAAQAMSQISALGTIGPSDDEIARVRRQLSTRWARHLESTDGRATALCEAEALGSYRMLDEEYESLLAVTPEGVRRVVATHLDRERACATAYVPEHVDTDLDDQWPLDVAEAVPYRDEVTSRTMSTVAPSGGHADEEHAGGVWRRRSEHLDAVAKSKSGTGLVSVGLHVRGLPAEEEEEDAGLSRLLARCSIHGAGGMDGNQLSTLSEHLGGTIHPTTGRDAMGWSLTVPSDSLAEAVSLLEAVAGESTLAAESVEIERSLQASDARRQRDDMFRYPVQQVLGQAYPTHPYGRPLLGSPERVAAFDVGDVRRWADRIRQRPACFVVVGDIEPARALDIVSSATQWRRTGDGQGSLARPTPVAGVGAETRDKKQSALAMAFGAGDGASPDREVLAVLCALLSGLAGRLFEELRERRSLAYTVAAMRWQARAAGALLTYVATSPEREAEARQAMLDELRRVVEQPPDDREFERARAYATGTLAITRQHTASIADELLDAWVLDALDLPGERVDRLHRVEGRQLVELCERLLAQPPAEFVVRGGAGDD